MSGLFFCVLNLTYKLFSLGLSGRDSLDSGSSLDSGRDSLLTEESDRDSGENSDDSSDDSSESLLILEHFFLLIDYVVIV